MTMSETPGSPILKVGDLVWWRGGFGAFAPRIARVVAIAPGGKNSTHQVMDIAWSEIVGRNTVVDLDNGHWAYGDQIHRYNMSTMNLLRQETGPDWDREGVTNRWECRLGVPPVIPHGGRS